MTIYKLYKLVQVIAVLIAPPIIFLLLVGKYFPPQDTWAWIFWLLGTFFVWFAFLDNFTTVWLNFRELIGWDAVGQIGKAFQAKTQQTLKNIQNELPALDRHLDRIEVQEVWNHLDQNRPVLIEGDGGSGKSVIAATIVRQATHKRIPTLFLDTRNYSKGISTFGDLEKYVDVKLSLRECLEKLVDEFGHCLLVIDQLDDSIGTPSCQISTDLLITAAELDHVMVLAVSRTPLDTDEYRPIKNLRFQVVKSEPLDRERASALLREMGVDNPPERLVALSENLLNLSLVGELVTDKVDVKQLNGEIELWEKYTENLQEREGVDVVQAAIDLAYETFNERKINFTLPRKQERALQRLRGRGLIISVGRDLYRFRHEQFLNFFYAQGAIDKNSSSVDILDHIAGQRAEEVLVWVLRLYCSRRLPELAEYLRKALIETEILDFYEKAALLDEVQTWSHIADYPDVVWIIVEVILTDTSLERYFFRHLAEIANPAWFEPLKQTGYLVNPPPPIQDGDAIPYPYWYASGYLHSIAPQLPVQILELAKEIQTENVSVKKNLLWIATNMPPNYAAQMVPIIQNWVNQGLEPLGEDMVSLMMQLVQNEQWDAAIALADLIWSPKQSQISADGFWSYPKAVSQIETHLLHQFLEGALGIFLERNPLEMLHVVKKNIEHTVDIEALLHGNDFSSDWPPAIESNEQNFGHDNYKLLLIIAAVRTLGVVVRRIPDQGKIVLEEYMTHRYSIFRRLAIHIIRENPALYPDLLEQLFTDEQYLTDSQVHHEYWKLMHETYPLLPETVRDSFSARLLGSFPQGPITDKEYEHYRRSLLLKQMWAVKDHLSSDEYRKTLNELVDEYGEPDNPSFRSVSRFLVGSRSLRTPEELSQMSYEDFLAELKKNLPHYSFDPDEPDQEGFAHVLRTAVINEPQHFALIAPQLLAADISPRYTASIIFGFLQALGTDRIFDWEPVLHLCKSVAQTSEEEEENGEPQDMKPGYWETTYSGARKMVAALLTIAIVHKDNSIPDEFLDRVREILLILVDDFNPSPEYERKWGIEHTLGLRDLVLNVTRSKAIYALLQYSLRIAKKTMQEQNAEVAPFPPGVWWEPVVKDKLSEKLDKQRDPSLAVHYLFGQYFPSLYYLDREWAVTHLEQIFPRQPEMLIYWEAACEGYFSHSQLYTQVYEVLKPYYRYAIEQMSLGNPGTIVTEFSRVGLTRHLSIVFWQGLETLKDKESLINTFFESVPDKMRAGFIRDLALMLKDTKPGADSEEWLRAKTLLEMRCEIIKKSAENSEQHATVTKELAAFGRWVPLIPEELNSYYYLIEQSALASEKPDKLELLRFLASVAQAHAPFVVSLLEKIMQQERDQWFLLHERNEVQAILEAAMGSGDGPARVCAERTINLFGQRGNETYRDLLRR